MRTQDLKFPVINFCLLLKLRRQIIIGTIIAGVILFFSCSKKPVTCPRMGYEYTYYKPGVLYTPGTDSIQLGDSIILEAAAPVSFRDEASGTTVTLLNNPIFGPFTASKASGNPSIPVTYAMDDFSVRAETGRIVKDSVQFTQEQLRGSRTVWFERVTDSFRLKLIIKPLIKGTYFIGLNQIGNRDQDCALFKYFLRVRNTDQHLYFLSQLYGGSLDENSRNYAYCFKVY